MPRITLTKVSIPALWATAVPPDVAFANADPVNFNQFILTGKEIVLVRNTGVSSRTITVTSVGAQKTGRVGDIAAVSIPGDSGVAVRVLQQFPIDGWRQSDGMLYLQGDHADVEFAVIELL